MRLHQVFEWDEAKARSNARKHRVTFDDAARVLGEEEGDRLHVEEFDEVHSMDEDRYVTTGSHPDDREIVLVIAWTERSIDNVPATRIISARAATAAERRNYAKEIAKK